MILFFLPFTFTQAVAETPANQYSLEQAMSDSAQLATISFSGLAFITGGAGADTFMPPGKVADFFGFQYMRDIDSAGFGHNTDFLSRVANNVIYILNPTQKQKLLTLAKNQAPLYDKIAYNRFPLMNAFRRNLTGNIPKGSTGLNIAAVSTYTSNLYLIDAELSYNRALVVGGIIRSFTSDQKNYLARMEFGNYNSWPNIPENQEIKRGITNSEYVALMTYASELFSWYKGSIDADVYFCPERHGTYFGGFYLKDFPAMNNPSYFIDTATTGNKGQEFLDILDSNQRELMTSIIPTQKPSLEEIASIRTKISKELRKAMAGQTINRSLIFQLDQRYGYLDGKLSALYATTFAKIYKTLNLDQKSRLKQLRDLDVVPSGAYKWSSPIPMPSIPSNDYLFGLGKIPSMAGKLTPPKTFSAAS